MSRAIVLQALEERRVLRIVYAAGGVRMIQPHAILRKPDGTELLEAFQVQGFTEGGVEHGWKNFDLSRLQQRGAWRRAIRAEARLQACEQRLRRRRGGRASRGPARDGALVHSDTVRSSRICVRFTEPFTVSRCTRRAASSSLMCRWCLSSLVRHRVRIVRRDRSVGVLEIDLAADPLRNHRCDRAVHRLEMHVAGIRQRRHARDDRAIHRFGIHGAVGASRSRHRR